MSTYQLTWITSAIAVGHAPMSFAELDSIREQGISAIVNLCGEYCDLHEIEKEAGFDVFFLPVPDETAPELAEMEEGLEWLDEATYLGKKVLIHCRHGIGRTGTFLTAYLLRRGFSMKKAGSLLKKTRAVPTNFSQWWLLRKFGRKEGTLTVQEPTPENRKLAAFDAFFYRYEFLLSSIDVENRNVIACELADDGPRCAEIMEIELIEAMYLHEKTNLTITRQQRIDLIEKTRYFGVTQDRSEQAVKVLEGERGRDRCLLRDFADGKLFGFRPASCRLYHSRLEDDFRRKIKGQLTQLSQEVFVETFGVQAEACPRFRIADAVSGRFIQLCFQYLAGLPLK